MHSVGVQNSFSFTSGNLNTLHSISSIHKRNEKGTADNTTLDYGFMLSSDLLPSPFYPADSLKYTDKKN